MRRWDGGTVGRWDGGTVGRWESGRRPGVSASRFVILSGTTPGSNCDGVIGGGLTRSVRNSGIVHVIIIRFLLLLATWTWCDC